MGGIIIIFIFIAWLLIKLISNGNRDANARREREAYAAKLKDPKYIAQRKIELEQNKQKWEAILKDAEQNPDIELYENPYVSVQATHWARLNKLGKSRYNGITYYKGERGGIYTLSSNGTRNYKY